MPWGQDESDLVPTNLDDSWLILWNQTPTEMAVYKSHKKVDKQK